MLTDACSLSEETATTLCNAVLERELLNLGKPAADGPLHFEEDWQLNQFWYSDKTAAFILAKAVVQLSSDSGKIACLSCPTLFRELVSLMCHSNAVFAFPNFHFYDYRDLLALPSVFGASFDIVVADPLLLSDECLTRVAEAISYIAKKGAKVLLCILATLWRRPRERFWDYKSRSFSPSTRRIWRMSSSAFQTLTSIHYCCDLSSVLDDDVAFVEDHRFIDSCRPGPDNGVTADEEDDCMAVVEG
ncbi:unnamed protein product [Notodromas monacha]|uniref:N(6)-adenine-specific DNA methyltransferase 2 n=1 Tax=Notodromas monacha TaxID=399045 RepID=A0A7R9BYU5_9CRUS|nr:unnamed protein product [Notodromas monacha]CAG0922630.1 unnamed protein product [Notodromas monacha]